jgi:hypothetical protein
MSSRLTRYFVDAYAEEYKGLLGKAEGMGRRKAMWRMLYENDDIRVWCDTTLRRDFGLAMGAEVAPALYLAVAEDVETPEFQTPLRAAIKAWYRNLYCEECSAPLVDYATGKYCTECKSRCSDCYEIYSKEDMTRCVTCMGWLCHESVQMLKLGEASASAPYCPPCYDVAKLMDARAMAKHGTCDSCNCPFDKESDFICCRYCEQKLCEHCGEDHDTDCPEQEGSKWNPGSDE